MGLRGPSPKDADARQRGDRPPDTAPAPLPREVPPPPRGLLRKVRDTWFVFWRSDAAGLIDTDIDMPALNRLWTNYDLRERWYRELRRTPIVRGSQGQDVLNPLGRELRSLEKDIHTAEDRFGLTPAARRSLGMGIGEARKKPEDLKRDVQRHEHPDPRLAG